MAKVGRTLKKNVGDLRWKHFCRKFKNLMSNGFVDRFRRTLCQKFKRFKSKKICRKLCQKVVGVVVECVCRVSNTISWKNDHQFRHAEFEFRDPKNEMP